MAEEGTAVLEPDTAVEEVVEEQPLVEEPENLEESDAPETEAEDAPETDVPPKSLADLTEEELEADERIQKILADREARARESARRKTEAEERKRVADQAREWSQRGQARAYLNAALSDVLNRIAPKLENGEVVDSSEKQFDQRVLDLVANQMRMGAVLEGYSAWDEQLNTQLPVGDKVSTEDANMLAEIRQEVTNGNFARFPDLIDKRIELGYQARLEKELPKLKKQWEADYKKQAKAAAENAKARAADETEVVEPTSRNGAGAAMSNARAVLENTNAPIADRRKAYREEYGIDPPW